MLVQDSRITNIWTEDEVVDFIMGAYGESGNLERNTVQFMVGLVSPGQTVIEFTSMDGMERGYITARHDGTFESLAIIYVDDGVDDEGEEPF